MKIKIKWWCRFLPEQSTRGPHHSRARDSVIRKTKHCVQPSKYLTEAQIHRQNTSVPLLKASQSVPFHTRELSFKSTKVHLKQFRATSMSPCSCQTQLVWNSLSYSRSVVLKLLLRTRSSVRYFLVYEHKIIKIRKKLKNGITEGMYIL